MDDEASAAAAMETMQAKLLEAMTRKDPAPIVELFADDAVVHNPSGTMTTGKEAIAARIAAQFPRMKGYTLSSTTLEASGDLAYGHATFQLTLDPGPLGGRQDLVGMMVVVMKRQPDRAWKLIELGSWIGEPAEMDHDMPGMESMPGMPM
jgi:ketosteroid isomerase-like protein